MKFTTTTLLFVAAYAPFTVLAQIPDFLITDFAENKGQQELEVVYGENKIQDGEVMSLEDVQELPSFKLCDSCGIAPQTNYIIMLLDVDGSGDPENAQTLHYLKTDFGSDLGGTGLVSEENALIPFLPPSLEEGDGPHRYVWLLFHQKGTITANGITGVPSESERDNFSVTEWLAANEGINSPDWGLHFVAEFGSESEFTPAPSPTPTRGRGTPTRIVDEPTETGDDDDDASDDEDDSTETPDDEDDSTETPDDETDNTDDTEDDSDDVPVGTPIVTGGNPESSTTDSTSPPANSDAPADPADSDGAASSLRSVYGGWAAGAVIAASMFFAW